MVDIDLGGLAGGDASGDTSGKVGNASSKPPDLKPARLLLLCADDFGLTRGIDEAIAKLVRAGRLSAFSCLTNGPAWRHDGPKVAKLRGQSQAGLHFNLTEGRPLSPALARHWPQMPSLPRLLLAAHARRLPSAALADELAAQWRVFEQISGHAPDFIDGHQHVHHLPGVRDLVLGWARARGLPVRSTAHVAGPGSAIKRWLIEHTGGRTLARSLVQRGLPHNRLLLGAYDFVATDYRALMQAWLALVPVDGALLFCHPGQATRAGAKGVAVEAHDGIAAARTRELAYLAGPDFRLDLAAAGVELAAVWPTSSRAPHSASR